MANNKIKKIKKANYQNQNESSEEIIKFIKLLIIVIIIILGIYFLTRAFIVKDLFNKEEAEKEYTTGEINYNTTIIGSILNKPEEEYYVIVYDSSASTSIYYNSIVGAYANNSDAKKVYFADLDSEFNKKFYDKEHPNLNTTDFDKLKFGDITLLKIKKGKIIKTFDKDFEIKEELKPKKDANS